MGNGHPGPHGQDCRGNPPDPNRSSESCQTRQGGCCLERIRTSLPDVFRAYPCRNDCRAALSPNAVTCRQWRLRPAVRFRFCLAAGHHILRRSLAATRACCSARLPDCLRGLSVGFCIGCACSPKGGPDTGTASSGSRSAGDREFGRRFLDRYRSGRGGCLVLSQLDPPSGLAAGSCLVGADAQPAT
ncbi:hypothetical protein D3C80_632350 [compost metagenome]